MNDLDRQLLMEVRDLLKQLVPPKETEPLINYGGYAIRRRQALEHEAACKERREKRKRNCPAG